MGHCCPKDIGTVVGQREIDAWRFAFNSNAGDALRGLWTSVPQGDIPRSLIFSGSLFKDAPTKHSLGDSGMSLLHNAAIGWGSLCLKFLLHRPKHEFNFEAGDADEGRTEFAQLLNCRLAPGNRTLLHCAVLGLNSGAVEYLLPLFANVDMRDGDGNTPLFLAAYVGNWAALKLLIGARADKESAGYMGVDAKTGQDLRVTPLVAAMGQKRWKCVRELLESGVFVDDGSLVGLAPDGSLLRAYFAKRTAEKMAFSGSTQVDRQEIAACFDGAGGVIMAE